MIRIRLRNRFLESGSDENFAYFRDKEINLYHFCEELKKKVFLIVECKQCSKQFLCKRVKLFLSNKTTSSLRLTLVGDENLITD